MIDELVFSPLLAPWLLGVAAGIALLLLAVDIVRGGRGWPFRLIAVAALAWALLDPRLVRERRESRPDTAIVVVDTSGSQGIGDRRQQTDAARDALAAALATQPDLQVRIVEAGETEGETRLFAAAERAVREDPPGRLAALLVITDGQVHDVPAAAPDWLTAPLHVLLSGRADEVDRRVVVGQTPAFGVVGTAVDIGFRVEDRGIEAAGPANVRIRIPGTPDRVVSTVPGTPQLLRLAIDHAGPTVVEIEAEPLTGEVADINNRAAVVINGVRDRLRVLLISGQPHQGERTWRNLLKADPAVDLVHFTILRPPEKDDATPLKELSLIVFPVQELFEEKLSDFDLVVFDRYVVRGILSNFYYERIAEYVRNGGALLASVGPEYASPRGLMRTPLADVLPVPPTGRVIEQAFRPRLTATGARHPVTSGLPGEAVAGDGDDSAAVDGDAEGGTPAWGPWYRLIEGEARRGVILMDGAGGRPLLVLDRVGEGRVAQLMSDQIWLWARGHGGGGPQAELLRRLAHWLMREPELEEESLSAAVANGRLRIARRSLIAGDSTVTVTRPNGAAATVRLSDGADGIARGETAAFEGGLYRIDDGGRTAFAAAGRISPPELSDLRATPERLAPLIAETGGGIAWLAEGLPELRRVAAGRDAAGRGWLGLQRNESAAVIGVSRTPIPPGWLLLTLAAAALIAAWWREGR
ncbi:MAG: hypothetical protein MUE49_02840 [Rhodospirillales bacterium]|nr:hypothetical protein [Rhodospirillales bacterium]